MGFHAESTHCKASSHYIFAFYGGILYLCQILKREICKVMSPKITFASFRYSQLSVGVCPFK